MEDDIDIYADLPTLNLDKPVRFVDCNIKDQLCNCEDLKKDLSLLTCKIESIQKIKDTLQNNLSSLLKTAKAEIARKDKMIDDLRKRLDDATFKRNSKNEFLDFSTHRSSHQKPTIANNYENVSSMHLQENKTISHQTELHCDKYKSKESQNDIDRISTIFGERLYKKIMEDEKDEKKQILKLSTEDNAKEIPEENIVESDKENGSKSGINNKSNESLSNVTAKNSEITCRNNSEKRMNQEDDTHGNKRLKIENNENMIEEPPYNCITWYDPKDNLSQYEIKDNFAKLENQLDVIHSCKKEQTSFDVKYRATSEHKEMKQSRYHMNEWRRERRSNSRDRDSSHLSIRKRSIDNLDHSYFTSASNQVSGESNSLYLYKKSNYRYVSRRKSYSRSRSDHESSNNHRLRERSNSTYRDRKYDDYKNNSRYKNSRLKRDHDSKGDKMRHHGRERSNLRDTFRHTSDSIENAESNISYKNKYQNYRIKNTEANISDNKRPHKNDEVTAEIDFQTPSRTVESTIINYNAKKDAEQYKTKNKLDIISTNSTESTSTYIAINDLSNLEEGEILDSPEKENNSVNISKNNEIEENSVKIILMDDKNEEIPVNASIHDKLAFFKNDIINMKQLNGMVNINAKNVKALHLPQINSRYYEETIQLNSSKNNATVNEVRNYNNDNDICKSYFNEDLTDSTVHNVGIFEQMHINNTDNNSSKSCVNEKLKNSTIKTNIKEINDTNTLINDTKTKKKDDPNIKNAVEKEEINLNNESAIKISENFNSDNICKTDNELNSITKIEAVPKCNIENKNKSQVPIRNENFREILNRNNTEVNHLCFSDHNYIQNSPINATDLDAVKKPSVSFKCHKDVPDTATLKETQLEKPINVQSIDVKKTMSSIIKNKKEQQNKEIVISRRRKAVILSDNNASMTILMNTNIMRMSSVNDNCIDNDSTLKPRACKVSRTSTKALSK